MPGLALPVVRVAQVLDVVLRAVRHQVRPGAHGGRVRVAVELGLVLRTPYVLGNDRRLIGDVIEVRLRRRVEREHNLVRALERNVREWSAVHRPESIEIECRVGLQRVEGVKNIVRGEWRAIAPGHAAPNGEGQLREAAVPGEPGGEPGRDLRGAVGVGLQDVHELEGLVDEADGRDVHRRVERIELTGPGAAALVVDEELATDLARVPRPPGVPVVVEPHAAARTPATTTAVIVLSTRRVFGRHVDTIRVPPKVSLSPSGGG